MSDADASPATPAVDEGVYRHAMGRLASGVCVLTTHVGGHDHAMTATAVTSVSVDPVLLLICVETDSRFHDAVLEAGEFGVSVLAADQRRHAQWFATQGRPALDQLSGVEHTRSASGFALLTGALATLECDLRQTVSAGDHSIITAGVRAAVLAAEPGPALVHFRGQYSSLF